jgi:RNA polymerase sigma-70 factor (ECF subfamily)
METTIELLTRAKTGDRSALDLLVERSLPPLRRWARGRLPQYARSLQETQDLVQNAVLRSIPRLATFEALHPGALQAFLRQAVANQIIDEIRKVKRRPEPVEVPDSLAAQGPSPLEEAIGREGMERYEAALARLKPSDREAIIARIELQQSYEEVALALGKPNANAARAAVKRAIERLLKEMVALRKPGSPGVAPSQPG